MKTLRRSIKKAEVGGEPLPPAFQAFERAGIILRRAEVTVIAVTSSSVFTVVTSASTYIEPTTINWYKRVIKDGKNLIGKDKFYSTLTNLKKVENN